MIPVPFIVGVPRSGTTLLRFMLDSHPSLAIPPETGFLGDARLEVAPMSREALFALVTGCPQDAPTWEDFGIDAQEYWKELLEIHPFEAAEGFRAFYRLYSKRQQKPRYGDKTPTYCEHIATIGRIFQEACFVHVIRDGRDAALSLRRMWFAPGQDMPTLALYWRRLVEKARKEGRNSRAYLEIRYEHLVLEPETTLRSICDFVQLDFHSDMLRYWERAPDRLKEHKTRRCINGDIVVTHQQRLQQQSLTTERLQPTRISGWKNEMSRDERHEFENVAGELLEELGYES